MGGDVTFPSNKFKPPILRLLIRGNWNSQPSIYPGPMDHKTRKLPASALHLAFTPNHRCNALLK